MTKLVIQLWQTSVLSPQTAATPFMLAASAAAMEIAVEIHALGASVELFQQSQALRYRPVAPLNRPLAAYVEDALRSGARVVVCSTAMRDRGLSPSELIEGCEEVAGMVTMLERLMAPGTTVLTY